MTDFCYGCRRLYVHESIALPNKTFVCDASCYVVGFNSSKHLKLPRAFRPGCRSGFDYERWITENSYGQKA